MKNYGPLAVKRREKGGRSRSCGYISASKVLGLRKNPSSRYQDFDIGRSLSYPAVRQICCTATKHLMLISDTVL
jgi:hypothetical protein